MNAGATVRPGSDADPLRPFVPRIAADWLREAPAAHARTFEGTLMFADVSGFTALTEALARRGREGAEEITSVLDAAFAELIGAAYHHHADLLKFGGDALLLLFRGDEHVRRAATAAWSMQRALARMRRQRTSAGHVRLEMSIGLHTGTFQFFLVGSVHRELIVTGADATMCVEVESAAGAGEIALSSAAAHSFPSALLSEGGGGTSLLRADPDAPSIVPPFFDPSGIDLAHLLPAAYARELRGDPGDPEHRHVAVAFVEISGTDELLEREGADVLADALTERIGAIQESCRGFGVTFAQTDVSQRAVKAILLAGAPRSAGGDEEELMLRAARAVVETPARLPVRAGVDSGRVFAGVVGTATRRTYTFYGDTINTAARIMGHASLGQLLAREDVLERARTAYALAHVEPFAVKGKDELVRAVGVGAPVGVRTPEAIGPFVGRELQLDALLDIVACARTGEGGVAIVRGDPGLGKTRLLGELRAQASELQPLVVQCSQMGAGTPYLAVSQLVRRALHLGPHTADEEVERRLRGAVLETAPPLEPWLPLLGIVLGLQLPASAETAALDESFVSERIAASVQELLDGLLSGPTLIAVDDAHFMDDASVSVVDHLARGIRARAWALVLARREHDGGFESDEAMAVAEVLLEPLDHAHARLLVEQLTDDVPVAAHVSRALAARSGGIPLFVIELAGAVRLGASVDDLPRSVEALMAAQIDELDSADRGALRRASVLGARFSRSSLATALGTDDPDALVERLRGFLVADGDGGLRFRHGLLRDTAYHGLSFRRRRVLHERVGEALERATGSGAGDVSDQLARHFFEAGSWERALRYGVLAGRRAQSAYANVDAARLYEQAIVAGAKLRGRGSQAVALAAECLGDVRLSLGELELARAAFVVARRRVRGDDVESARLRRKEATAVYRLGDYPAAQRILSRALALVADVRSVPATRERARIGAWLGIVTFFQGRPAEAVALHEEAIAEGEWVDAKKALAQAYFGLDLAYNALGESPGATYSKRALALYEELGELVMMGAVLNNLGAIAYYAGRWNEALDLYGEALEAWERAGDTRSVSMASFNVGEILSAQGRLTEAEPLLRSAERASRVAGGGTDIAESLLETALLDARQGDVARALEQLAEARSIVAQEGDSPTSLLIDARTAEVFVLGGDHAAAEELVEASLVRANADEGGSLVLPTLHRVRGHAQLLSGQPAVARESFTAALLHARRVQHRYEEALAVDGIAYTDALEGIEGDAAIRRDGMLEQLGIVSLPRRRA